MLYIVATPIGNLDEISFRAVETLKKVSLIAAEDTRHSAMLLRHLGIKTPMQSYQKFSEKSTAAALISRLLDGEDIALISDAGMPLISDPGAILVDECIKNGIEYTVISGPSALINALVLSGLPTENFSMLGFLPDKQIDRKKRILPHIFSPCTLVFYSPPQSVLKDLEFLHSFLGARKFAVVREISKLFEEVVRGVLGQVDSQKITLKGEFVLVIQGYSDNIDQRSVDELLAEYLSMGLDKMDAIKRIAKDKNMAKSDVYKLINT